MAEKNQTEKEFFAVATIGRKGLEEAVQKMTPDIMAVAAPDVVKAGRAWLARAIITVSNNEKLAPVLQSRAGLFSIIKSFERAATMGLQFGGQFPHAHLIAFDGKAELIISAEGYRHAATSGPGAVLASCEFRRVYEGEQVRIDVGAAKVDHVIDVTVERGKLIGVYGILTRTDGTRAVDYMTRDEAIKVRDGHSSAWKNNRPTPWKTDEDAMVEKTAAKRFLKKYAAESEALAMLYSADDEVDGEYTPPPRDIGERMESHIERRTMKQAEPVTDETPAENAPEPAAVPADGDLF